MVPQCHAGFAIDSLHNRVLHSLPHLTYPSRVCTLALIPSEVSGTATRARKSVLPFARRHQESVPRSVVKSQITCQRRSLSLNATGLWLPLLYNVSLLNHRPAVRGPGVHRGGGRGMHTRANDPRHHARPERARGGVYSKAPHMPPYVPHMCLTCTCVMDPATRHRPKRARGGA
eukprot:351631-Chlamydomonas_euryale.AAC.3